MTKRTSKDEEEFHSAFFTDEEVENTRLTRLHNLPSSLVRELQAKSGNRLRENRVAFSCSVWPKTHEYLRKLAELRGTNIGRALDFLVDRVQEAIEAEQQPKEPNKLDRMTRRKKH